MGEPNIQTCDLIADTRIICTASFAVRKDALKSIGGFDLNQRGTLDDVEVGFRLNEAGYRIIHHPLPKVLHFHAPMSGARDKAQGNSWSIENRVYFQLKHRYESNWFFLLRMLTSFLRPSREWLRPSKRISEYRAIYASYLRARGILENDCSDSIPLV
jgi:GT2 family glycosyltransferase